MKRVLLTIIFCLFASSMANAQCAWVLYERVSHNLGHKEGKWELRIAFPSYNECLEAKESEVRALGEMMGGWPKFEERNQGNKGWVKINPGFNVILWDEKRQEFTIWEYQCFPDTINPRK